MTNNGEWYIIITDKQKKTVRFNCNDLQHPQRIVTIIRLLDPYD